MYSIKLLNQSLNYKSFVKYNKQVISKTIVFNIDTSIYYTEQQHQIITNPHLCFYSISSLSDDVDPNKMYWRIQVFLLHN